MPAGPDQCFDLARSQAAHVRSVSVTRERVVEGPPYDLLRMNDQVTFEGMHLGIRWRFSAKITDFQRPHRFSDVQIRGPFRAFRHDHIFEPSADGTIVRDVLEFQSGFGPVVDFLLGVHLKNLLTERAASLKLMAEDLG